MLTLLSFLSSDLLKEYLKESRLSDIDSFSLSNALNNKSNNDVENNKLKSIDPKYHVNEINPIRLYLSRYRQFMNAPRVHFFYDSVSKESTIDTISFI